MTTHRRPTMNDVADDAGVSLKTVSRVVNGVTTVDPALAERVMASVRTLGFRRNDLAATLRSGTETRTIALITADLQNPFYTPITAALAAVARSRGHQLITASSQEDPDVERATALDLCQRRVRALVVVPTAADHSYLASEVASGIPVVFVDRPGDGVPADQVLLDDRGGADSAITDLLDRGHRRIAVLLDRADIHTMAERLAGVRQGLERVGLALDPRLVSNEVHTPEDAVA
ncbi:MAG: LacI family DNA-binding transcriptional regulator, partial [Williamsia herbipolensis]|nr:LacI family DNA-binding transcriptional regulator [Williamsia herbipolensis]